MQLQPDAPQLTWQGAVSLQKTKDGVTPWRTPHPMHLLFPQPLIERSAMPAGIRINFQSNTKRVSGTVTPQNQTGTLDLCCDGEHIDSFDLTQKANFTFENLSDAEKLIELWLPQFGKFQLRGLEIDDGATFEAVTDTRPRWITYGSSITQCRTAASPTQTWPAIVARERNLNLTCLGYGGQCHLDIMIALMIRDMPADYISMCLGINIQGGSSLGPRTFRPAIIGAIQIIRERHPETPIVLMSPICSPPREERPNAVGFHLKRMREEVQATTEILQAQGDKELHYVDGLTIFGEDHVHLLPDALHPDAEGYRVMGKNFITEVAEKFFV